MRTLVFGDNLKTMKEHIRDESIDLIYADPPFFTQKEWRDENGVFIDKWNGKEETARIHAIYAAHDSGHLSSGLAHYLTYMHHRIREMSGLLKPTGSIYLHCNTKASAYLRVLMDYHFPANGFVFRNEIVWARTSPKNNVTKKWGCTHDCILFYSGEEAQLNPQYMPMKEDSMNRYNREDSKGFYRLASSVSSPGGNGYDYSLGMGEKKPSRGYGMPYSTAMKWLKEGTLVVTPGKVPQRKYYLHESKGRTIGDIWSDVCLTVRKSKENTAYPTQKPLSLLKRIILASSQEGDLILDPFCGSGTTCLAADLEDRQWIGIDESEQAIRVAYSRFDNPPDVRRLR